MSGPIPQWRVAASRLFGWRLADPSHSPWASRASQRALARGVDLEQLTERAGTGDPGSLDLLAELCAVDETYFLRNVEQLDAALEALGPVEGGLRAWSAGCASGEEVYTLAALIHARFSFIPFTVLGTDVDPSGLRRAERGAYTDWSLRGPDAARARALLSATGERFDIPEALRSHVRFVRHNLVADPVPVGAPFHLVTCRNVLVYLEAARAETVLERLSSSLGPGGVLAVSPVDAPRVPPSGLAPVPGAAGIFVRRAPGRTEMRKVAPPPPPQSRSAAPQDERRAKGPPGQAEQLRGMSLLDQGELASALAEFQAALERDPKLPLAWLGLALVQTHQGRPEDGRRSAERVLQAVNGRPDAEAVPGDSKVTVAHVRALATSLLEGR